MERFIKSESGSITSEKLGWIFLFTALTMTLCMFLTIHLSNLLYASSSQILAKVYNNDCIVRYGEGYKWDEIHDKNNSKKWDNHSRSLRKSVIPSCIVVNK